MKRIMSFAILMIAFVSTIAAHPINVTLSNGKKVVLESNDYPTMADLMNKIYELEKGGN